MMFGGLHKSYFGCDAPWWWTVVVIVLGVMPLSYVWRYYRS